MLLGARQFFAARKAAPSIPTARDYVQMGLVAMWDGIENAGWGTHDANVTVWKDLIDGSRYISLPNNTQILGDRTVFSSAAQSTNIDYDTSIPVYSVFHTFKMANTDKVSQLIFTLLSSGTSGSVGSYSWNANLPLRAFRGINWREITLEDYDAPCQVGIIYSIGSDSSAQTNIIAIYCNGAKVYELSGPSWYFGYTFANTGSYQIGGAATRQQGIFNVRLYSRALTAAEIAANYAIDKARFNLP